MSFAKIRPRRSTTTEWEATNPVLRVGELGIEFPDSGIGTGLCKFKLGDGNTKWKDLAYAFDASAASGVYGGTVSISHDIWLRQGTTEEWEEVDPVLGNGEIVFDSTEYALKVGDGKKTFTELDYISGGVNNLGKASIPFTDSSKETDIENNPAYLGNIIPANNMINVFTNMKQLLVNLSAEVKFLNQYRGTINEIIINKANKEEHYEITLEASKWSSNGTYDLDDLYPSSKYSIEIEPNHTCTVEQLEAFSNACVYGDRNINTIHVGSYGEIPEIDIPVIVHVEDITEVIDVKKKRNRSKSISYTLLASSWSANRYDFSTVYPNDTYMVTVEPLNICTKEQIDAWEDAMILGSASSNTIYVGAGATVPNTDIPVILHIEDLTETDDITKKQNREKVIESTLQSDNWEDSVYKFEQLYPSDKFHIVVEPGNCSKIESNAWNNAKILRDTSTNTLYIGAGGRTPDVDIPVIIHIQSLSESTMNVDGKANKEYAYDYTMTSDGWTVKEGRYIYDFEAIYSAEKYDVVVDPSYLCTEEQMKAWASAMPCGDSVSNTIYVGAGGKQPTIDIPVILRVTAK